MAYPEASDWTSSAPRAAWYIRRTSGGGASLCALDGWTAVARLQTEIAHAASIAGRALPSYDGTAIAASDVRVLAPGEAARWDADLLRGLYAAAAYARAPADALAAVQADAFAGTVGYRTLQTAIWLLALACGTDTRTGREACGNSNGTVDSVDVPLDRLVLPAFGADIAAPIGSGLGDVACTAAPGLPPPTQVVTYAPPSPVINPLILLLVIGGVALGGVVLTRRVPTSRSDVARRGATRRKR